MLCQAWEQRRAFGRRSIGLAKAPGTEDIRGWKFDMKIERENQSRKLGVRGGTGFWPGNRPGQAGFTLAETMISIVIMATCFAGYIEGYILVANRAQMSAYSLAAHSLAQQGVESCRSAQWDTSIYPAIDYLQQSNFPNKILLLDVPTSGTNYVWATNFTTISTVSTSPPVRMVRVDTVWAYYSRGLFTNTAVTYRGPNQ
jgi:prepilin-type N-terminal cleavage/methylation domain-containing protein